MIKYFAALLSLILFLFIANCSGTAPANSAQRMSELAADEGTLVAGLENQSIYFIHVYLECKLEKTGEQTLTKKLRVLVPPIGGGSGKLELLLPSHLTIPDGYKITDVTAQTTDVRAKVTDSRRISPRTMFFKVDWKPGDENKPEDRWGKTFTGTVSVNPVTAFAREVPAPVTETALIAAAKNKVQRKAKSELTWGYDLGRKFTLDCIATKGQVPFYVTGERHWTYSDPSVEGYPNPESVTMSGTGRDIKIKCDAEGDSISASSLVVFLPDGFSDGSNDEELEEDSAGAYIDPWKDVDQHQNNHPVTPDCEGDCELEY